ncbi:glycosyltransferase family 2 protein [Fulvivirga lutimaris]|uniref:glycosyltransferase family 2 protein n=1 Tax=Fulvivirga lutimaris TaxID=1819566 RepID=UPI0012BB7A83|nr:glycosyltransferase [Fulvivirga lutimaris]MTI38096.1 glycosyltransferase [Fulvivirga lutimaris]
MKLISIVMPAYNAEPYISKAIESILNQTHTYLELLISDDGSTDNTRKIIDAFEDKRIRRFHNSCNMGNLKTINKLFAMTQGDYIAIQDADDWSDESKLELQLKVLEKNLDIALCGTQSIKIDNNGRILKKSDFPQQHSSIVKSIPEDYLFTSASVMMRKIVYDQVGGLNEYFDRRGGADWYWLSILLEHFKMINLSQHLYFYRYNSESITNKRPVKHDSYTVGRVIAFLFHQRKKLGSDGLMDRTGSLFKELLKYEDKLNLAYVKDPLLLDREYSVRLIFQGKYLYGFIYVIKNFMLSPLSALKWYYSKLR